MAVPWGLAPENEKWLTPTYEEAIGFPLVLFTDRNLSNGVIPVQKIGGRKSMKAVGC